MKKIRFMFIVFLFFGSVFANECNKIGNSGDVADSKYFQLYFSRDDLEIARSNLRDYCNKDNSYSFLESPYWYDHLLDVLLRKIDGRKDELYPNMISDEKSEKWIDFISDIENTKNPSIILEKYKKNWTQTTALPSVDSREKMDSSFSDLQNSLENLSLYDKYINACFLSMMIYYKGIMVGDLKDLVVDGHYYRCLNLVRNKIRQELIFARSISQYSAATMLVDSWKTYTNQFVQNRTMKLFDRIGAISLLFNTFASQAPLEKECTK